MGSRVRFPVLPWGFFLEGEDPHGQGSSVEFRFKTRPGTSYSYITIHLIGTTPHGRPNLQKSVTLRPQPEGETTKSIRDMWWQWEKKNTHIWILQKYWSSLFFYWFYIYIYIYFIYLSRVFYTAPYFSLCCPTLFHLYSIYGPPLAHKDNRKIRDVNRRVLSCGVLDSDACGCGKSNIKIRPSTFYCYWLRSLHLTLTLVCAG
jgi:hypothetical protein